MEISLRNVTSKTQAGATTIVMNKPGSVASGDVMYAYIYEGNSNTHVTAPGWTEVAFRAVDASNCVTALRLVAGGAEPSTYTFTGSASGLINGHIIALIGVDNTTPEDAVATINSGSDGSLEALTILTVTDNAWHLVSYETTGTQATLSLPTDYTNDVVTYGAGGDVARADHKVITPAGASGTAVSNADVAGNWIAISVAVRPAAAAAAGNFFSWARS